MTPRDWRSAAACRDADPEQFFPAAEEGSLVYDAQVASAKAVCADCAVRAECLDEALIRIPEGIAGGLTPQERRTSRRAVPGSGRDPAAVLATGPRRGARPAEVRAAGRVLLAAGRPIGEVATRCGVTPRTAARWAGSSTATTSTGTSTPAAGGAGKDRGGSRALPLIPPHQHAQAGTRAAEGHRG